MSDTTTKYARKTSRGVLYPIAETFYSVQGEGYWTGTPAFFIRLAGCSVGCAWCDTDYRKKEEAGHVELVERANAHAGRHVVLTGGEPTDHDLLPLVAALREAGFFVQIETSGTKAIGDLPVNWITVSPKCAPEALAQTTGNECKVVFAWPRAWYPGYLAMPFGHFFIQPLALGAASNAADVVEYVKSHPRWRISLQTHKILGVR